MSGTYIWTSIPLRRVTSLQ